MAEQIPACHGHQRGSGDQLGRPRETSSCTVLKRLKQCKVSSWREANAAAADRENWHRLYNTMVMSLCAIQATVS